ncbi:uncharacterized protein [Montipora foliosa]|uniref:uncharacterized protein isoform X1 n=1 Tax=Montipora foliosa TaxID=591990 RepID=UPI0035F1A22B
MMNLNFHLLFRRMSLFMVQKMRWIIAVLKPLNFHHTLPSDEEPSLDEKVSDSQESLSDDSDCSDVEMDDEVEELEDIAGAIDVDGEDYPLPDPAERPCRLQSIVMWALCFLLIWQYCYLISDNAVLMLVRFLKTFLTCIGEIIQNRAGAEFVLSVAGLLPSTMHSFRKILGINRDSFERYVVCPMQVCKIVQARRLPRSRRRKVCDSQLVKKVILKNGTPKYYPLKVYCYKSVIDTLEIFLKRPNFEQACEQWRNRQTDEQWYGDVYDGKVWKSFDQRNKWEFFSLPRSFGLMVNVDWFQPLNVAKTYLLV